MPPPLEELKDVQRPKSAFVFFLDERKSALKKSNTEGKALVGHEITKLCNTEWQAMRDDERQKYQDLAKQDAARYESERRAVYSAKGLPTPEPYVRLVERKKMAKARLFSSREEEEAEAPEATSEAPRRKVKAKRLPVEKSDTAPVSAPAAQQTKMDVESDEEDEAPAKKQRHTDDKDAGAKKRKSQPIDPRDKLQSILKESMRQQPKAGVKVRTPRQQLHKTMRRLRTKALQKNSAR
eukprot:EG_transcript_26057